MAIKKKTQTYKDGAVKIYSVSNIAPAGNMPVDGLTLKKTVRYDERTVGLERYTKYLQDNVKVQYVLRCPRLRDVSTQDIAIPNDKTQYEIKQIQYPQDIEPPSMDLTLSAVKSEYDIYQPEEETGNDTE